MTRSRARTQTIHRIIQVLPQVAELCSIRLSGYAEKRSHGIEEPRQYLGMRIWSIDPPPRINNACLVFRRRAEQAWCILSIHGTQHALVWCMPCMYGMHLTNALGREFYENMRVQAICILNEDLFWLRLLIASTFSRRHNLIEENTYANWWYLR